MASSDLNIGPTTPAVVPAESRALVRVAPVTPQPATHSDGNPLNRSGLDVLDLLTTADNVVMRQRTPALALEMGLEQARGAMVRNQPADALAALDEVWSGARHTETGWYLRASSLALLGLPAEASRIAADALVRNPQSSANHFLQSLARLTLGDVTSARLSIANAIASRPPDALLLIQSALLEAQQGNVQDAEQLLRQAAADWPDHAALPYGRRMIREVLRRSAREQPGAPDGFFGDAKQAFRTPAFARTPVAVAALDADEPPADVRAPVIHNAATQSLHRLGAQLVLGSKQQVLIDARALLVSLSAGGTLSLTTAPARAHAMRAVVGAVIDALHSNGVAPSVGWDAESVEGQWQKSTYPDSAANSETDGAEYDRGDDVLFAAVRVLVYALRDGRVADAEHQLRRAPGALGDTTLALLRGLVKGAEQPALVATGDARAVPHSEVRGVPQSEARAVPQSEARAIPQSEARAIPQSEARAIPQSEPRAVPQGEARAVPQSEAPHMPVYSTAAAHVLLTPLRLGLALLPESDLPDHSNRVAHVTDAAMGYAAAQAGGQLLDSGIGGPAAMNGGWGGIVAGVGLLALAVLAFSASQTIVALALIGAAGWVLLRKQNETSERRWRA